jgi:hypothetical protein
MKKTGEIDPLLVSFLNDTNFSYIWSRIRCNVRDEDNLIKQFNCWFDGFKTLKLINHLSRSSFPPIDMFTALDSLLKMQKIAAPHAMIASNPPALAIQKKILQYLREIT